MSIVGLLILGDEGFVRFQREEIRFCFVGEGDTTEREREIDKDQGARKSRGSRVNSILRAKRKHRKRSHKRIASGWRLRRELTAAFCAAFGAHQNWALKRQQQQQQQRQQQQQSQPLAVHSE